MPYTHYDNVDELLELVQDMCQATAEELKEAKSRIWELESELEEARERIAKLEAGDE